MDGHSSCAPRTVGPRVQFMVRVNKAIDDRPGIQQEAICYQWFKQRLILSISKPSISQRSQITEDTVEPSVPAREFNLKAYAALTWYNDRASLGLEPRLADHRSQAARQRVLRRYQQRHRGKLPLGHVCTKNTNVNHFGGSAPTFLNPQRWNLACMGDRTQDSFAHEKFSQNRSRDSPLWANLYQKFQIWTIFGALSPHLFTYNNEICHEGADLWLTHVYWILLENIVIIAQEIRPLGAHYTKKIHFKRFWGITPTFLHLQCESKNWTLFHLVQMVQDRAIVTMASQK